MQPLDTSGQLRVLLKLLLLAVVGLISIDASALPENAKGWTYYTGNVLAPNGYTDDPGKACELNAINHMQRPLEFMRPAENAVKPEYECWYRHWLPAGALSSYAHTFLHCNYPYVPVWPGVCVKESETRPQSCPAEARPNPSPTAGNPILLGSGAKYDERVDFQQGDLSPFDVRRYYRSIGGVPSGYAGMGWRFSFERKMLVGTYTYIALPDGTVYRFIASNGGFWGPSDAKGISLRQVAASPRTIEFKNTDDRVDVYTFNGTTYPLTSSRWRGGYSQSYVNDGSGRPVAITDSLGRGMTIQWDGERVSSIRVSNTWLRYTYQATMGTTRELPGMSVMTSATVSDGSGAGAEVETYHYEDVRFPTSLTGITDPMGRRWATYAYNAQGLASSSERAGGAGRVDVAYATNGSRTVSDALGQRTYAFSNQYGFAINTGVSQPAGAGCNASSSAIRYDGQGNVAARIDFNGNQACFYNDTSRNLEIKRIEGTRGSTCPGTSVPGVTKTTSTQWHPTLRVRTALAEPQRITYWTHDPQGNVLLKTVRATQDVNGSLGFNATHIGSPQTWTYTYDAWGRMTSRDGPRTDVADVETFAYDASGNLVLHTNALGQRTEYLAYTSQGWPTSIRDANGLNVGMSYDVRGRLLTWTAGTESMAFGYDLAGNMISATASDGRAYTLSYDNAHRLTQMVDAQGNRVSYTLDSLGNRVRVDVFGAGGQLAQTMSRVMDPLNRVAQITGGRANSTNFGYDPSGNQTSVVNANGNTSSATYDGLNRLTSTVDGEGGRTTFAYNGQGDIVSVTAPNGAVTRYTVDGLGNRVQEVSPDRGTTTFNHDAAGNVTSMVDARGVTTHMTYDALNRVTSKTWTSNGSVPTTPAVVYVYDQGYAGVGRMSSVADETGTTMFSYDLRGRITQRSHSTTTGQVLASLYGYDSAGRLVSLTYPTGLVVNYQWAQGRVNGVSVNGQQVMSQVSYHAGGAPQSWQWGAGGATHGRGFDLDGNLTSQVLDGGVRSIVYDPGGRVQQLQHDTDVRYAQALSYDRADRLTAYLSPGASESYSYDPSGNRLSRNVGGLVDNHTYTPATNRLTNSSGTETRPMTLDAAGHRVSDGSWTHTYDTSGRRVASSHPMRGASTHRYNGLAQRSEKQLGGSGPVRWAYDNEGRIIGEYDYGGNQTVHETIWLADTPVAVMRHGQVHYIHADHLGTPRAIKHAATGRTVWRWAGSPFGTGAADEDPDIDGIAFPFGLRFPGQTLDRETGLHQNWHRDYDASVGRYTQSDPIGLAGGINTYAYVGGNPLMYTDPNGLWRQSWRDASDGFVSYFGGLRNAGVHMYRRAGFSGACFQRRAIENEAALAAALNSMSDPRVAQPAAAAARSWANDNKAYLFGRVSAGAMTSTLAGVGPYGGVSLGLVAGMGDALYNIDRLDATSAEDVLRSILGDRMANLPAVSRTDCECSR